MTLTTPWPPTSRHHITPGTHDGGLAAAMDRLTAELRALRADLAQHLTTAPTPAPAPAAPVAVAPATTPVQVGYSAGRLVLDFSAHQVHIDGQPREITAREWALLSHLAQRPGQVLTRADLLQAVWGTPYLSDANVSEHIRRVRRRLAPLDPVSTLRGVGYRWDWHPAADDPARLVPGADDE